MLRVADIDEGVVAAPAVRVDGRLRGEAAADNGSQRGFRAVRRDLRIDLAVTLQEAEDRRLPARAAAALVAHAARAEVALVNFDLARKRRSAPALFGDAPAELEKGHGDGLAADAGQLSHVGGRKIRREVAQRLTKLTLGNPGTSVITVSSFH